jgi:putative membrane protein
VHLLVHLHLVLAGYLLPAVLVGRDPLPHRRPYAYRAAVLVAALAAHGILAKYLYTRPPLGVGAGAAEQGAMVMYYGGDAVELVVAVLLCRRWFGSAPGGRPASTPPERSGRVNPDPAG